MRRRVISVLRSISAIVVGYLVVAAGTILTFNVLIGQVTVNSNPTKLLIGTVGAAISGLVGGFDEIADIKLVQADAAVHRRADDAVVQIDLGSFDRRQLQGDVTGQLGDSGNLAGRLVGVVRDSGMQTDEIDDDRVYIAPSITWRARPACAGR